MKKKNGSLWLLLEADLARIDGHDQHERESGDDANVLDDEDFQLETEIERLLRLAGARIRQGALLVAALVQVGVGVKVSLDLITKFVELRYLTNVPTRDELKESLSSRRFDQDTNHIAQ